MPQIKRNRNYGQLVVTSVSLHIRSLNSVKCYNMVFQCNRNVVIYIFYIVFPDCVISYKNFNGGYEQWGGGFVSGPGHSYCIKSSYKTCYNIYMKGLLQYLCATFILFVWLGVKEDLLIWRNSVKHGQQSHWTAMEPPLLYIKCIFRLLG